MRAGAEPEAELRKILDPDAVNDRAFADRERRIAQHGAVEALKKSGDFGYAPAPGQTPVFGEGGSVPLRSTHPHGSAWLEV